MPLEALGPYEILKEWGTSPVGRVLLARDRETDRDVTIQLFEALSDLPAAERDAARQRLLAACSPLVGLEADQIAGVLDVDDAQGLTYVVTERVEGTALAVYCKADALLPEMEVLGLGASAARGLDAAHRAGAVHGAVHPAVLLRVGNGVKVAGFGLSAGGPAEGEPAHYQSPEQVRRQPIDARSDLFSLGAVLYEMLTGHRAFPGASISAVLYRIVSEPVREARELAPRLHETTADLLRRALAKEPAERFADGEAMAQALEDAAVVIGVDATLGHESVAVSDAVSPSLPPSTRPAPHRMRLRPFLLGAFLLSLLAFGIFTLQRRREQPPLAPASPPSLEAHVRTEPPGVPLALDGEPVELDLEGRLRFPAGEPYAVLSATLGCRTAERRLEPGAAGDEIVLVLDPLALEVAIEPAIAGARIALNGQPAGETPALLTLDLCRDNRLELSAPGHRTAALDLPAGATPLDARKGVYAMALEPLPRGRLALASVAGLELEYFVDGERIGGSEREVELDEGQHVLRFKNDFHWLDETAEVRVAAGETTTPELAPRFGTLVVQAFPANCRVFLRRPGQAWRYMDDTPAERRVATGAYEVKVQLIPTGETRVEKVRIGEGVNPAVRVSFGSRG